MLRTAWLHRRPLTLQRTFAGPNVARYLLAAPGAPRTSFRFARPLHASSRRCLASPHSPEPSAETASRATFAKELPVVCPGCGALSQTVDNDVPGYYSPKAKRNVTTKRNDDEDRIFAEAMARLAESGLAPGPPRGDEQKTAETLSTPVPICDRCHFLMYQSKGEPIIHPSMQSIEAIIEASPHRRNHIYHVLDAADFPMSLIPNLTSALRLPRLRTQNRRSKSMQYVRGREAEVSFIITRSDLLAPQKEQVDRLMPYLQEVLRDALGRTGRNVRLGNISCVSAQRGWWTTNIKSAIWARGGAGWFVGRANVGKSALFEVVFPKGRDGSADQIKQLQAKQTEIWDTSQTNSHVTHTQPEEAELSEETSASRQEGELMDSVDEATEQDEQGSSGAAVGEDEPEFFDESEDASLLPPAQPETPYPQMPLVSSLPGTTASPIRIPFGKGKGELIDLPGVERSLLEKHVQPEHRSSLVMTKRVVPEQQNINPGQSLLIGGMIRITPTTENVQFLGYGFVPLDCHTTSTAKAIAIQTGVAEDGQPYTGNVPSILTAEAKMGIKSAGRFKLQWNVTTKRAGPLTDKAAGRVKAERLPFIIYSADILIEGVGWVELVCQMRKPRQPLEPDSEAPHNESEEQHSALPIPEVEVFSPEGKYIDIRRPMNAWLIGGRKKTPKHAQRGRPRMTISMKRRQEGGRQGFQRIPVNDT